MENRRASTPEPHYECSLQRALAGCRPDTYARPALMRSLPGPPWWVGALLGAAKMITVLPSVSMDASMLVTGLA